MGWFEFLDEREAAKARAADEAGHAGLEEAWARVGDLDFVEAVFARLGATDPDVAQHLQRLGRDGEGLRILMEGGAVAIGPLIVARLASEARWASEALLLEGTDVGRPLGEAVPDGPNRVRIWASSPWESDRDRAFAAVAKGAPELARVSVAGRAAAHGDLRGATELLAALRTVAASHASRGARAFGADLPEPLHPDVQRFVVRAFTHRPIPGASGSLVELLRTTLAFDALEALGTQGDPSVVPALQAYRDSLVGDPSMTAPLQVWADLALHRCGLPPRLDAAHAVRALMPRRYGYPKREHLAPLHAAAARLFHGAGVEGDWVGSVATSDAWIVRQAGLLASPGPLEHWDAVRAEAASTEALWDALSRDRVVWRHNILRELAGRDDVDVARLGAWCRARLESVDNHWVHYDDDLPELDKAAVRALQHHEDLHDGLADTSSAWIRSFVLDLGKLDREQESSEPPAGVAIERIDRVPFVLGHQINGVALSSDGSRLAVLGDQLARVLDARTGETLVALELRWSWGYAAAWSPDGTRLAAAFHGGHVEVYDASTGVRLHDLRGHSGVPHGVRALAWGAGVLVSGGQDGLLIGWDPDSGAQRWVVGPIPGNWQRVRIAGDRGVAAHVKTGGGEENFLLHFDPRTGEGEREPTDTSVWAIALRADGLMALGGEGKGVTLRKPGQSRTWRKLGAKTHRKVVELVFLDDGLHGITEDGRWTRFDVDDRSEHAVLDAGPPLWALDGAGHAGFAGGKAGVVHRVGAKGALLPIVGASHARKIVGLGDDVSLDWDGHLLRWPPGGGAGEEIVALGGTPESLVTLPDGWLLGTRQGLRRLARDGSIVAQTDRRSDDVAVIGGTVAHGIGSTVCFASLETLEPVGEPVAAGADDVNALAPLGDGVLVGNEKGQVAWVVGGRRVWEAWDHGTDGLESGNPHCDVCSIAAVGDRFATGATDSIVRVYRLVDGAPRLQWRIACGFGLFNRLALDPSGRWLVVPTGGTVALWDLDAGTPTWRLTYDDFGKEQLTVARFAADGSLTVGTGSGRLFSVRWT